MFSIKVEDIILFPIYVAVFYYLIKLNRKKLTDPLLKVYLTRGFMVKILACIAFTIFNTYLSPGDSIGVYFPEGVNLYQLILKDPSNLNKLFFTSASSIDFNFLSEPTNNAIFVSENNYMVVRITAMFSFLSFGSYLVTNLFFTMLSFAGMWRLYRFFYALYPKLHKELAIAILYFPTVIFWSSGIFKDPVCLAGIGFITYALYQIVYTKKAILTNALLILVSGYLLINLKIYILISYLPCLLLFLVLKNIALIKNTIVKILIGPTILIITIIGVITAMDNYKQELGMYAANDVMETIKRQQTSFAQQEDYATSNFNLGVEFDGTVTGLIKIIPFAITATLFRPFIWESNKLSTLLSSLESLAIMLFTLYVFFKAGFLGFFRTIIKDAGALYSYSFAMIFGLFVGASTLNFGSLVRYKIPCLPFYLIALFIVLEAAKQKKKIQNAAVG